MSDAPEIITETIAAIGQLDAEAMDQARRAMDAKVKPLGSLGLLEDLVVRLAGMRGTSELPMPTPAIVVLAADHGVVADQVSAYPQEVTAAMLSTFASGASAVSVLARRAGARLVVADLGVLVAPVPRPGDAEILDLRVRPGTANSATGPAMTREEAEQAVVHGIELVERLVAEGVDLIGLGEMGIGNTTTASALTAAYLGRSAGEVCGPGTGLDEAGVAHKVEVVERILQRHSDASAPMDVLARIGGLEVAGLVGVILGAAAHRVPVLVDGFITGAAAVAAAHLAPQCRDFLIAAHRSTEPGHLVQHRFLDLLPLLDLRMRLGEGSGAAMAVPVVASAVAVLREMGTFESVGLADAAPTSD